MKKIDLTGQRFARLLVIKKSYSKKTTNWECLCDCGKTSIVYNGNLRNGNTKSCGCIKNEKIGALQKTHGETDKSTEYNSWKHMKERCISKKYKRYANWGGRGITMCERWLGENGFINFLADMGRKPSPNHTIDRTDNDKGYSPENCRWATPLEQGNNQRTNVMVLHIETGVFYQTIAEAQRAYSLPNNSIGKKLKCNRPCPFVRV